MPNGLKKFLVNNEKEVDLLLMHNKSFAAEVAHGVSSRNRIGILARYDTHPKPLSTMILIDCFVTGQKLWESKSQTLLHGCGRRSEHCKNYHGGKPVRCCSWQFSMSCSFLCYLLTESHAISMPFEALLFDWGYIICQRVYISSSSISANSEYYNSARIAHARILHRFTGTTLVIFDPANRRLSVNAPTLDILFGSGKGTKQNPNRMPTTDGIPRARKILGKGWVNFNGLFDDFSTFWDGKNIHSFFIQCFDWFVYRERGKLARYRAGSWSRQLHTIGRGCSSVVEGIVKSFPPN